jgi:hypothetical protein
MENNKPTDRLFNLIHSLSRGQKRHFSMFCQNHRGDNQRYLSLFNYILRQKEHDEEDIRKWLSKTKISASLATVKNGLTELILRSMRASNVSERYNELTSDCLIKINFLLERGLYRQLTKFLNRTKKAAAKQKDDYMLLELLDIEKIIYELAFRNPTMASRKETMKERSEIFSRLDKLVEKQIQ